jgi:glycine cleavage system regulatory protein
LSDEYLVVIPLPTSGGGVTYAVARLVSEGGQAFAEAIAAIPDTVFAPPRRVALSAHSLTRIRPGLPPHRPNLYLYEGMIMPPSN